MKDRLLTLGLAVAAFALFYALFAPKPAPPQDKPTRPTTIESGPNGYLALMRWFETADLHPMSLRERFGELPKITARIPTGNVLISTAPHLYPPRDSEIGALRDWISAGNTLVVAAGFSDTPEWSMGEGIDAGFISHMQAMTGLTFTQAQPDVPVPETNPQSEPKEQPKSDGEAKTAAPAVNPFQKLDPPQRFEMIPNGEHPLLEGVKSVAAISEYPTAQWRASSTMSSVVMELGRDAKSDEPAMWLARYGEGQIIVLAYGSSFTNKLIGQNDNAQLLANIVNLSRSENGRVIIDDAHQGLVAFYDPEAFFGDKRLHASLWWLLGLWLVFVLGSQKLRPVPSGWNPVEITSFVRASGGFMARVLKPATAAQRLFSNFFNDLRRQIGLPVNGAPVWDWIGSHTAVPASELEQLQRLHVKAQQGQRVDLRKLHNLLVQVRHQLS